MPNAGFETKSMLTKELDQFKKICPHIEIEITIISWSKAWQKLIGAIKNITDPEAVPDVVQIGSTWQGTLSYLGRFVDLSSFSKPAVLDDFIEPLLSSCYSQKGKQLFSIPWFSDIRVLYYRKDFIEELNITEKNFSSWEGFRNVLHEVKIHFGNKIAPMSLSGQSENIQMHDLAPWIWSANSDFINSRFKKSILHENPAQDAIRFYFNLIHEGYIPILGRDHLTVGNFFSGNSVFQISGVWPMETLFNPKSPTYQPEVAKHIGVSLLPSYSGNNPATTFIGGSHLAIFSSSNYIEEAWLLIKFLTDKQKQENHAKRAGVLPARKSSFVPLFFGKEVPEASKIFMQAIKHSKTFPSLPILGSVEQVIKNFAQNALNSIRLGYYDQDTLSVLCHKTSLDIDYLLSLYE